jgi:hypothetical protein
VASAPIDAPLLSFLTKHIFAFVLKNIGALPSLSSLQASHGSR